MLIEKTIELQLIEGAWDPWPNKYFYNWLFSWQNKNL